MSLLETGFKGDMLQPIRRKMTTVPVGDCRSVKDVRKPSVSSFLHGSCKTDHSIGQPERSFSVFIPALYWHDRLTG